MEHGMIYTDSLICRYRARIRGIFSAVTKPTPVSSVISRENFQENLFMSVLSSLLSSKELNGVLHGRGERATFVPHVYAQSQGNWVDAFYSANGYLDFEGLARIGIDDPKGYARRRYGQAKDVEVLKECMLGPRYISQLEAALDDAETSATWTDVVTILPSSCSEHDVELLLERFSKKRSSIMIFGTVVCSREFLKSCMDSFKPLMVDKAKQDIATNQKFLLELASNQIGDTFAPGGTELYASGKTDKKEERRRKAAGQTSSSKQGMQVREKKTHKIKEKGGKSSRSHNEEDLEDEGGSGLGRSLHFMSSEEILSTLQSHHPEAQEEFLTSIASDLLLPLKHAYQEEARRVLGDMKDRGRRERDKTKKSDNFQVKVQELWSNTVLFGKTILLFEGFPKEAFEYQTWDSTVLHLSKHLLKTICTDLVNLVVQAVAEDHMIQLSDDDKQHLTPEKRNSVISEFSGPTRARVSDLCHVLNGKSVDLFFGKFESLCSQDFVGIHLKRPDKKIERQIVFAHCISLAEQLKNQSDPAMALHIAVVLVFIKVTGSLLHAPGRVVSQVIAYLQEKHKLDVSPQDLALFHDYHDLVVKQFKEKRTKERHDSESAAQEVVSEQEVSNTQEVAGKQEVSDPQEAVSEQEVSDTQNVASKQEVDDTQDTMGEQEVTGEQEIAQEGNKMEERSIETELVDRLDNIKEAALKYMSKAGRTGAGKKSANE
jgi:hypothetical protein